MHKELKKTNTLFHSSRNLTTIKKIINEGGFKASYAKEIIEDTEAKTLMVSFSNVALFESETQVFYGNYAIGLNKDWGIRKKLEPVMYTYQNSDIGSSFIKNIRKIGRQLVLNKLKGEDLDKNTLEVLDSSIDYLLYLKPYLVKNNRGKEFIAYNDREWRYVHHGKGIKPIIFKSLFGNKDPEYDKINHEKKPFTDDVVLNFDLEDINFIIVNKNKEKNSIFKTLFKRFGKDKVLEKILNGNIDILSRESIKNNL